jgi:hypothetical protein
MGHATLFFSHVEKKNEAVFYVEKQASFDILDDRPVIFLLK